MHPLHHIYQFIPQHKTLNCTHSLLNVLDRRSYYDGLHQTQTYRVVFFIGRRGKSLYHRRHRHHQPLLHLYNHSFSQTTHFICLNMCNQELLNHQHFRHLQRYLHWLPQPTTPLSAQLIVNFSPPYTPTSTTRIITFAARPLCFQWVLLTLIPMTIQPRLLLQVPLHRF